MRSQKQVRHVGKIRCLKNAAAGKWKTYRKRLEARKAWQNSAILTGHKHVSNTLSPPRSTYRRIKEPKQRSPEELAERQRLREQRRLEKKLAKQRASTSTLPEIRKEKKLKEVSSSGSPKRISAEPKIAAKTTKAKNSMVKETVKVIPKLENGSKSKHQCLKEERPLSTEEEKRSQSSSPVKLEQKKLVQSKKTVNEEKQSEVYASTGKTERINKEQKKKKRSRRPDPDSLSSEHDFVEGNTREMDYEETKADLTEIVERRQKKKGRHRDEQQPKSEEFTGEIKEPEEDILEQIMKQEKDVSGKKENKGLNEAMAYLAKDQSCALESTGFKTEKIMDHIIFSSDKIPEDSEELEMNVARLAEEHPKLLGVTNLNFSGNITGDVTMTTYTKGTKCDVEEKKEPIILVSQTNEVSRILPTRERVCKLLPRDIQFCVHMIEKHGEDYEAMAKDQGNIFRDSVKGISRKIRIFKESPQYETYLKQKAEKNGSFV
ncbi:hypothetical protein ACH3XW_50465 [Acanthocheilonema viteae]